MDEVDSNKGIKKRLSIRLPEYDYGQVGAYFVTVLTHQRKCVMGDVVDEVVQLSQIGKIVESVWREIPVHFPNVSNDEYVIMPNHLHGIIHIQNDSVGAPYMAPLRSGDKQVTSQSPLGVIIGNYKAAVTREIRRIKGFINFRLWQRNYYEHVIRDERDFERVLDYIHSNPMNWEQDSENPFG